MLKRFIDRIIDMEGSVSINDLTVIKTFTDNPDFPYLVSFPRTGSHWLRMIMELYFGKPSLIRAFYFRNAGDFTCYHTHDMTLELERQNVIYLYRNPIETIYSQLCYYNEDPDDPNRRHHWTDLYAQHLSKWLVHDNFTRKKTVLTYEGMKWSMEKEFSKVCHHFGQTLNVDKLDEVLEKVSKEELKRKTLHDGQVVNLNKVYANEREIFREKYAQLIFGEMLAGESRLKEFLAAYL